MAAPKMEKTRYPGIYRRGSRYVVVYRAAGKQRKEFCRTLEQARRLKTDRQGALDRGEFQELSRVAFREYAEEWIGRYRGNGRRGITPETLADYKRDLERYAYPYFDERLRRSMAAISPRDIANWIGWLCEQSNGRGGTLTDQSVRRILTAVRSCMATAKREGLIRHNPADGAALPHRERLGDDEEEQARAMTRAELGAFLQIVAPAHRLFFTLLASTGVRVSEAIALRWRDLHLDGSNPHLKVRRAIVRGRVKPPKSKHGRRSIPLDSAIVFQLRGKCGDADPDDLVFSTRTGGHLNPSNMRQRVLQPAAEEANVPWIGFHTFRHTCASMLFARGRNAKQVQRWLGHHAASFTLDTYTHLLDDGLGDGLDLSLELDVGNALGNESAEDQARSDELTSSDLVHLVREAS
jgi:integrase